MKVKFRYGIKSYSGKLDDLIFANYEKSGVVIGRELPAERRTTKQNMLIGSSATAISEFYKLVSERFKADLEAYTLKMYDLKPYNERISGNKYSTFVKMIWGAVKDSENPLDITSLPINTLLPGQFQHFDTVKDAVDNGYLPVVDGYEEFRGSLVE